jgi:hypothetical protein
MDADREIPLQSQRFTSWHNVFLFAGWPAFGYDAAPGKVIFALAMAVGTRRMENQEMAVRCRRSSPVGFSMAEALPERPAMVRPPLAIRSPPLKVGEVRGVMSRKGQSLLPPSPCHCEGEARGNPTKSLRGRSPWQSDEVAASAKPVAISCLKTESSLRGPISRAEAVSSPLMADDSGEGDCPALVIGILGLI